MDIRYTIQLYNIHEYIDRGKFVVNLACYYGYHLLVSSLGGEGMGYRGWIRFSNLPFFKVYNKLGNVSSAMMSFSWATDLDPKGASSQIKDVIDPSVSRMQEDR